jgi:hypothetical protein
MTLAWDGDRLTHALQSASAEGLLRAAVFFQAQHVQRLSLSAEPRRVERVRDTAAGPRGSSYTVYDRPSRPGEYLRLRTGHGRGSTTVEPLSPDAVKANGMRVRVGYRLPPGAYMLRWERRGGRLGLLETLDAARPVLSALAGSGG